MAARDGARRGRTTLIVFAVVAVALMLAWSAPAAAETIETEGAVYAEKCTPCHAEIAESKSSEIIFTHAYHLLIPCSSCHSEFPHRPEGTDTPEMKDCWNCHNLFHGPQGKIASGECEDCHRTPVERLRPSWHTWDWAEEPHVAPSMEDMRGTCMMCHDEAWCVDCHEDEFVEWEPEEAYTYDPGDGCLACHGDETLTKVSEGEPKSYTVTGVDESAHQDIECTGCHPDFKYEEGEDPTKLWAVNAGLACMECHDDGEQMVTPEYLNSIHGQEIMGGNLEAATCSSCHGGHYIQRLSTEAAQDTLQASAYRVCARCHLDEWESFDDYYHGAAYKAGATDAPACWDCHGSHAILDSADPSSTVSAENLPATCGGSETDTGRCHGGDRSTEQFTESAGELIHQKVEAREQNALMEMISGLFGWLS